MNVLYYLVFIFSGPYWITVILYNLLFVFISFLHALPSWSSTSTPRRDMSVETRLFRPKGWGGAVHCDLGAETLCPSGGADTRVHFQVHKQTNRVFSLSPFICLSYTSATKHAETLEKTCDLERPLAISRQTGLSFLAFCAAFVSLPTSLCFFCSFLCYPSSPLAVR